MISLQYTIISRTGILIHEKHALLTVRKTTKWKSLRPLIIILILIELFLWSASIVLYLLYQFETT